MIKYCLQAGNVAFLFVLIIVLDSCHSSKKLTKTGNPTKNKTVNAKSSEKYAPRNKYDTYIKNKYSSIIGVSKERISNKRLYSFVDQWYGVPYRFAGNTRQGVDCSDFASILLKTVYGVSMSGGVGDFYKQSKHISKSEMREGDLVFFNINGKMLEHMGIYLQNNKFVHASVHSGVTIDDLDEPYYKKYYYKSGRR
jgi:cell wall-associated NlpC family hydrolase